MVELPALRSKPSYTELSNILTSLEVKPRPWDNDSTQEPGLLGVDEDSVQGFLLGLLKSDFCWFEDILDEKSGVVIVQEQIDEIVDLASRRIAERCGRSARGESTRTFRLELTPKHHANHDTGDATVPLELLIREPPLTGDNLGLKTWGSAWTMVQLLPKIGQQPPLQKLLDRQRLAKLQNGSSTSPPAPQVLELGAGTGLVGMAAAALWGVSVVLTDLPEILENLQHNVNANLPSISDLSDGDAFAEILNWKDHGSALPGWPSKEFEVILAVDPLYDDDHPQLLANTIKQFSKPGPGHFVLTAVPFRDNTTKALCEELEDLMVSMGFEDVYNGENICRDDWESVSAQEVMVRWALWQSAGKDS